MPVSLSYEFKGYQRVRNSLRRLASDYRREIDHVVKSWSKDMRAKLKGTKYPPQLNKPQPFKTDRQRRYFFWALREGIIQVPYPRTGKLANSWAARKQGWADWIVRNSQSYTNLVVGRGQQAGYHRGHWWVAEDIVEGETADLTKRIASELEDLAK